MQHDFTHETPQTVRFFKIALLVVFGLTIIRGVSIFLSVENVFDLSDTDDIMRMMSVRSWREGQSWFDMHQYQLLAPDGVSLHWSRYIDFGIGALVWMFALVVPISLAEQWAAIMWPLLLFAALIMVVGYGTKRLLGSLAASIAMFSVVLNPATSDLYFTIGKLDHHNVQVLLLTIAVMAMSLPNTPVRLGIVAGMAAATSLAIGLETLFFLAIISVLHVINAGISAGQERLRLTAFCISISAFSLLLFVGQTAPHDWFVTQCDKLSPPYLLVCWIGASSGLAALAMPRAHKYPALFLATVATVTLVLLSVSWSVISPCLQAPYANLPQIAQSFIQASIVEALPLHIYAAGNPLSFFQSFAPAITALIGATVIWLRQRYLGRSAGGIWQMLLIGWIALAACMFQSRQIVVLAAVAPVLTGYAVRPMLQYYLDARTGRALAFLYTAAALTLFQPLLSSTMFDLWPPRASQAPLVASSDAEAQPVWATGGLDENCDNMQSMALLNTLPSARILSSLNLGPRLILTTHHIGMAAPYHRSADAMMNGFIPLSGSAEALSQTVVEQSVDYILVCRAYNYGDAMSVGTQLAGGAQIPGFEAVTLEHPDLMIFRPVAPQ